MNITNKQNIDEWSTYDEESIQSFGDDGDISRQHLLNPIIFELIGNVENKSVLDAGCGTGYLSRKLAKMGAKVTGVEPAQTVFEYISIRETNDNLGIKFIRKDLSKFDDKTSEFDVVVANMVFMDIPDYETAIKNCVDSLKTGGIFVFSVSHPCFPGSDSEWQRHKYVNIKNYFDARPVKNRFGYSFDRPLQNYINLVIDLGCNITHLTEPQASAQLVAEKPIFERNHFVPQFLVIKSVKK